MSVGRRVHGEGPTPCDLMVIGESIGQTEAVQGRVFASRKYRENEINRFFDGVRLPAREELYLTTYLKEWAGPDDEPTQADYDRDLPTLLAEIKRVQPKTVVAIGREVCRLFLGDINLEEVHGLTWQTDAWPFAIHCCYSPAAGFHAPEISAMVAYDFVQLEAYLDGRLSARRLYDDPYPSPDYRLVDSCDEVDAIMSDATRLGADTEGWPSDPWSVQVSTAEGGAYIIRYADRPLIDRFAGWVNENPEQYTFIFQSALHDLSMFRAFGIDTRRLQIEDTAIMAYNLQLEPLGLKPLCVRHLGMAMQSYDDVMGDAGTRLATDWLLSTLECEDFLHEQRRQAEFDRLTTTPYTDARGHVKPGRKLRVLPKLPKSNLHKAIERCLRSETPRKLWGDQRDDRHIEARGQYGAMWPATLSHVPLTDAVRYAGRDADGTLRLEPVLRERIEAAELVRTYNADLGTVHLIDRMSQIGIKPDLAHFASLSTDLGVELTDIQRTLELSTGLPGFNANSTYQVGDLLYGRFNLPELKQTPGGDPSTNDKILEALEKSPEVPPDVRTLIGVIREYREVYKLKHTFVDAIPEFVGRWPHDGRIHATFRITRVVSGRLAASDPNLLAMPKHGKFAGRFREGFVAGDGHYLGSWDLSQIELRVLAHLSQDPVLLDAFRTGKDLHAQLAQRIFGIPPELQDKSKHRLPAKAVNFGIPMGMTEVGLCIELKKNGVDVTEDDAKRWLDETMALYRLVPAYQQSKVAEARRTGFVCDLNGRRRYCGGIRSNDPRSVAEAERFAFSTPIQSGAQQIVKVAEKYIWESIVLPRQARGEWVEPILQIHDDLLLEFQQDILYDIDREMVYALTQVPAHMLCVPIETSGDYGTSWGSQKEIRAEAAA